MPFRRCSVPGCTDHKSRKHAFPRQKDIREIWLERVANPKLLGRDHKSLDGYRICERHFHERCRNRNGRLLLFSLPTLHLPVFNLPPTAENCFLHPKKDPVFTTPEIVKDFIKDIENIDRKIEQSKATSVLRDDEDLEVNTSTRGFSTRKAFSSGSKRVFQQHNLIKEYYIMEPESDPLLLTPDDTSFSLSEGSVKIKVEPVEDDFTNMCRTCLSRSLPLKSAFDAQISDIQTIRLIDFIEKMTSVKIAQGDGLPENLCIDCIEKICKAYSFSQLCISSDNTLKELHVQHNSVDTQLNENVDNTEVNENEDNTEVNENDDNTEVNENDNDLDETELVTETVIRKERYKCEHCKRTFPSILGLVKHQSVHNTLKPYKCKECSKAFIKEGHLHLHMRAHTNAGAKPYVCTVCGEKYTYEHLLKQHSFKHTREKPFPCLKCNKGCLTAETLKRHMRTHDKNYQKKKHVCNICSKEFPYPSYLTEHMKNHTGEKPYLCSTCGKAFRQRGALEYHTRSHTGYKPYKCQLCPSSFSSRGVLTVHMRIHTNERPYVCDMCGLAFRQSTDMKSHRRRHTGDKRALCTVCGKRMATTSQLNIHLRSHTGERPYSCDVCKKAFSTRNMLVKHKRIHTGEKPYMCTICGRSFNQSSTLKTHSLLHNKAHNKTKVKAVDDKNTCVDATNLLGCNVVTEGSDGISTVGSENDIGVTNEEPFTILPAAIPML